jgi:hypothetical protein
VARLPAALLAAACALALPACTGGDEPALLLLPAGGGALAPVSDSVLAEAVGADLAGELGDVRSATLVDAVPGAEPGSCDADWLAEPVDAPVLALPDVGFTLVRTGEVEAGGELTLVCDYAADGRLLVADDLRTTGTNRAVGNDYATRAGTIAGRVDVGVPDGAAIALQRFDGWALLVPLEPDVRVLRLHALEGGSAETGFDVGRLTFLDPDGRDVTAASIPIPEVIHGVPRGRGSAVESEHGG